DAVPIAEEIRRRGVVREGIDDLLSGPGSGRMLGHVEVEDAAAVVGEHDKDEEDAQLRGGNREEIDRDEVPDMVGEERPPCLGRRYAPLRHQAETVRSASSMPSFRSSPWIRGAPHKGFIAAIFLTRATISALIGGRPTRGRPESLVQCSRKRRRCHRGTVSGVTISRGCRHPAQAPASQTQKRRSVLRSLGRLTVLLYTASWSPKARFSRASGR